MRSVRFHVAFFPLMLIDTADAGTAEPTLACDTCGCAGSAGDAIDCAGASRAWNVCVAAPRGSGARGSGALGSGARGSGALGSTVRGSRERESGARWAGGARTTVGSGARVPAAGAGGARTTMVSDDDDVERTLRSSPGTDERKKNIR